MPQTKSNKEDIVVRSRRRTVVGVVTSDKMDKTVTVRIERLVKHAAFEKTLRLHDVCYAHDEKREARRGDRVELMETRPLSKRKHWRLIRVLSKAASAPERDAREAARPGKSAPVSPAAAPPIPPAGPAV